MKLTTLLSLTAPSSIGSVFARRILTSSLLGAVCLTLGLGRASAANLIWDPLGNNGGAGSGNWDTTSGNTVWWNGTSDVLWSQTSTTSPSQGATFNGPDAAPGTYAVSLDAGQIAVNSLIINNNGYTFSGANPIYVGTSDILSVAAGKTVTFNCPMAGSATSPAWELGSGSTMNVGGSLTTSQQLRMGGPANSAFYLNGPASAIAIPYILAPVYVTGGSFSTSGNFFIAYPSLGYSTGTLTVSGGTVSENGGIFMIARAGGQGTLTIQTGGTVNVGTTKTEPLAISYDGNAANVGTLNMQGGVLNVGASGFQSSQLLFFDSGAAAAGSTAVVNQTGGTIAAWGGIVFGLNGGAAGSSATFIQSGGTLDVGPNGITKGAAYNGTLGITLSGGTVGDLALPGWSSSLPITLGTANGNITFNCANTITLSGALTGAGGLYVTGGTLALNGANNYSGSTVVSNGTLAVATSPSPTSGSVTLDGSTGSPTVTVNSTPGASWSIGGPLAFTNGTTTLSIQFGALPLSPSVAPLQVSGDVAFTATPNLSIGGAAIAKGTYPLIKYTGTTTGTLPTVTTWTGTATAGSIVNNAGTKTISLVVTGSSITAPLYWAVASNTWDTTTPNWKQSGAPADYTDGDAVIFDDSASGSSPITVTLNTTVNPTSVTFNNTAKSYALAGAGGITGSGVLALLGSGTVTLNGTNSYSGGTVISAGQLNINNGGDAINGTAIGTGPLTNNAGAKIDNTSGADITLQTNILEYWNGNFTYLGSSNSFNTGSGSVTLGNSLSLAVNSNTFTVGGSISDNGLNYALTKTGNGTLTLPVDNFFEGGLILSSGQLNLGVPNAAGQGVLTITGGAFDNISGVEFTLAASSHVWGGNFSFLGSANLDLRGNVVIPNGLGNITVNMVSNTLSTSGDIVNNNTRVVKTGNGTWEMGGPAGGAQSLGLVVSAGQVNLNKSGGQAIQGGNNVGLTVQTGAVVLDESNYQIHSDTAVPIPIVLSGGVWDLNGHNENVDELSISGGGTLRNGAPTSTSTITTISGYTAMLSGANCQFDVTAPDGTLNFNGALGGSGSLVKVGLGLLNLNSNNTYTGNTTVSNGTLALAFPCLANASTVTVATNAILQLNFAVTNTVGALVLNGVSQPLGIYNAANTPAYLAGTGSLLIGIPTNPTNITFSVSANTLSLSWPSTYVGWILQTNSINVGVSNDWYDVPGSSTNNQLAFPMNNPAVSNEFFRLRYP
jgi:autotransporter-associated beta strand protein